MKIVGRSKTLYIRGEKLIFIIITSKDSKQAFKQSENKHSNSQKTSIQRSRKMNLKGIYQHFMLS